MEIKYNAFIMIINLTTTYRYVKKNNVGELKVLNYFILMSLLISVESFGKNNEIEQLKIKVSVSGLHTKYQSRELRFNADKKVFEKNGRKEEELLWNFFSVFYRDVQKYDLLNSENKKLAKTFTTCNEVIKLEISNSRKKKTFEVCDSPKQKGKIPEKIIKWKNFLLN